MSSRTEFAGRCNFCRATVSTIRKACPKCGKPVHCEARPAYAERDGSWASTSWTCGNRAKYEQADGSYVCHKHRETQT